MRAADPEPTGEEGGGAALATAALDAVLQRLTHRLTALLGLRAVAIILPPDPATTLDAQLWGPDLDAEACAALIGALGSGPAGAALSTGRPVGSANLLLDRRWPVYRQLALEAGHEAVCALPVALGTRSVGAAVLVSEVSHPWSHAELAQVEVLLELLAGYLLAIDELRRAQRTCSELRRALDGRVETEPAEADRGHGHP